MFRRTPNKTPNSTHSRAYSRTGCLRSSVGRRRSCAGFTMTELIVIIVMVGILATTVGMKSGWLTSGSNLRMAIDQVAGDLRFLRARTMASYSSTPLASLRAVTFPASGMTYNLGGQVKSLPSGVTISVGSDLTLTFNSLGEYNTTADSVLTLNSRGATGSIKIYHVSGNVEAY